MSPTVPGVSAALPGRAGTAVPDDMAALTELALDVARDAAGLLRGLRETIGFADPAVLRDAGDRRAHELITGRLAAARPEDVILSEEAADDPARLSARRVWIVDPLDGTREFGEVDRHDWAVHIALWDAGVDDLILGVIALPALGTTQSSTWPPVLPPRSGPRLRVAASRSRPQPEARAAAAALDADLVPLGSAGYKIAAVISGEVDAYVHSGGQYQWDSAAPIAVARAAGLFTSRLDGSPLRYNEPDLALPDLVVCRPELAPAVLAAVAP